MWPWELPPAIQGALLGQAAAGLVTIAVVWLVLRRL